MTGYPLTPEGIRRALEALGSTPAAVAARLIEGGHLGIPGDCTACPVVRYLEARFPGSHSVVATEGACAVYLTPAGDPLVARMTDAVTGFIDRFDNDDFRELREHPFAEAGATS